ncbi:MAG: ACT domain-containing protein, partial [Nitriliruptorales bacterium]|nr:ACT domain-containing protein [Nitriliruptorales bacterium]
EGGEVTVEYLGAIAEEDCRVLGLTILRGMLGAVVHEPVTFVNAPLLAEERGLHLREITDSHSEDYVSLLRISGRDHDGSSIRIAGTVFHPGERERITEVWNIPIDVEPAPHMAFFRYEDRPGVIGTVGTVLGEAGVNIAAAQVGRHTAGGEAIMALSLDDAPPREVVADIAERIGAYEGRAISL